jgi:hypothetical protein
MEKFISQLIGGETINVKVDSSPTKSECLLVDIEFYKEGAVSEHAVLTLTHEGKKYTQIWYTDETVEVVSV